MQDRRMQDGAGTAVSVLHVAYRFGYKNGELVSLVAHSSRYGLFRCMNFIVQRCDTAAI